MTVQECYEKMNGNIEEARARFNKDERIIKYLNLFLKSNDFEEFFTAIEAKDWETAFRNSHNVKGMALNLSITGLADISSEICELLRHGAPNEDINGLKEKFRTEYTSVMDAIRGLNG